MSEGEHVTTEALRDMVCRALEHRSLRAVAREIEVSPTGLQKFARGRGGLYRPSRKRLLPWYWKQLAKVCQAPDPAIVAAAVDVLLRGLADDAQDQTRAELAAILDRAYGAPKGAGLGVVPPSGATGALRPASGRVAGSDRSSPSPPAGLYLLVPAEQARFLLPDLPPGTSLFELPAPPPPA